jgi:hypothetical protein
MASKAKVLLSFYGTGNPSDITKVQIPSFQTGNAPVGTLLIRFSGSAYSKKGVSTLTLNLHLSSNQFTNTHLPGANNKILSIQIFANHDQTHIALVEGNKTIENYLANTTYYLAVTQGTGGAHDMTTSDNNDYCGVTVVEYAS